jgi:hypothetical protein
MRGCTGKSPFQKIYNYQAGKPFNKEVKNYRLANKEEVREKLTKSKERMQRTGEKRSLKPDQYKKGDQVYLHEKRLKQKGKIRKLDWLYRGLIKIVSRNENKPYKIALLRELGQVHNIFHVSKLRSSNKRDKEDGEEREEEKKRIGWGQAGRILRSKIDQKTKKKRK